jgi:arylsulfatase
MFHCPTIKRAGYRQFVVHYLLNRVAALSVFFAAVFLARAIQAQPASDNSNERPHILLIMSDDMGYSDLGCFGGEIETPNLDELAFNGLRFTKFYSENMCWVSRASMLTGVYHKTSLFKSAIHPRCVTLPETLRSMGYQTRMSGKWHLAGKGTTVFPVDRGFEHAYGILGGASSFFAPYSLTRDRKNVEHEANAPDYYFTNAISDTAVEYIEQSDGEKPLFMYMAYTAAHWPLHAFPKDIARYKGKYSAGWDELRKTRLEKMKKLGVVEADIQMSARHPNVPAWKDEPNKAWQERRMEVYAAQVTVMDEGIGRVINALRKSGRLENTLVLFTIDNGGCHVEYGENRKGSYLPTKTRAGQPMKPGNIPNLMPGPENTYQSYGYGWANASNTPYRMFKQFDHEGGIHTPMIAHWPKGITQTGGVVRQVSHLVDIMPTLLHVTNIKHPKTIDKHESIAMDGRSLKSHLIGKADPEPRELYFYHAQGRALRDGDWKLVKLSKGKWELYNLKEDPNELKNLAERFPDRVRELHAKFEAWEQKQVKRSKL